MPNDKPLNTMKFDQDAIPLQLLPMVPCMAIAVGFGYGAEKYEENSWRNKDRQPVDLMRTYGSVMRHLMKWSSGEELDITYDDDGNQIGSGLPHLWLAGSQLMILIEHAHTGSGGDSRHKEPGQMLGLDYTIKNLDAYHAKMKEHREKKNGN